MGTCIIKEFPRLMVKYQFLHLEANVDLLGERSKRRWWGKESEHEASDYKIKKHTQKYFNTKRKPQWRGANKVTDTCDIK